MIGVEAVAEIGGDANGPWRRRVAQPRGNGSPAVGVFPGEARSFLQLFDTHPRRTKDYMLPVIEFPVLRKNSILALEAVIETGAGERRDDGEARQVDLRVNGE